MADATLIATTLGTAAITGGVGVWAGLQQAKTSRGQLRAENDRFRAQFAEQRRGDRRGGYEALLNSTHEFALIGGMYRPGEVSDIDRWIEVFQARLHSVSLVAGPGVLEAATALDVQLFGVLAEYREADQAIPSPERLNQAYKARKDEIYEDYKAMLAAMRADLDQEIDPLGPPSN